MIEEPWTAKVALVDVRSNRNQLILPTAEVTLRPMAPLVFLASGGDICGAVRTVARDGDAIMATGTANRKGVDLLAADIWRPEIDLQGNFDATTDDEGLLVIRQATITCIVLGGLPVWRGLWIRLDSAGPPPP